MNKNFEKKVKEKSNLAFWIIMLLQLVVIIVIGFMKSNFHQDELFSLETAHYFADSTPNNCYMHQAEIFTEETWLEVSNFKELLTVDGSSSVFNDSINVLIKKIIFNNLYEFLINVVAGIIAPGSISKWVGIIVNIPFIILGQVLLYKLVYALRNKEGIALLAVALYGFSGISLGFSVYTRFYCFVLAMILVAMYFHYKMWKEKKILLILLYEIISYFCLFEAFVSSELVAIIVAGLYFSYLVGIFIRKQWKHIIIHISPIVIGFGYFLKDYMSYFINILNHPEKHITAGEPLDLMIKGATSLSVKSLVKRAYFYFVYLGDSLFGSIFVLGILFTILTVIIFTYRKRLKKESQKSDSYIYVIFSVICIYSIFSIIVALWLPRYYALVYPLIIIVTICIFDRLKPIADKRYIYIIYILFGLGIGLSPILGHIDNVYYGEKEIIQTFDSIDDSVHNHVIWNMEDFQIIMECVYHADSDDYFYVCSEDKELNFSDLSEDFILWIGESEELSREDISLLFDAGYEINYEIGIISDANLYYIKRTN